MKNLQNLSDLTTFRNIKLGKAFSSGNRSSTFADVDSNLTLKLLFRLLSRQMQRLLCLINSPH